MIRLKIMYLPFLYLKNGFGEGTTEIASRSQLTQNTLAAACYPSHPLLPHSQHVPCQPVLVLSAASLASVTIMRGHWDHFLSSKVAPQFSHTASAGRARV